MNLVWIVGLAAIDAIVLVDSAFAGLTASAPGPIAGVGLPALALAGGAYWLGRRFFGRKK